jgi:aminopeptidase N
MVIINSVPTKKGFFYYRNPVDLSRWRGYFLAHEIAHQWWGQTITWDTYHDQWLSEGFAQFSALLFLKEKYGEGVFRYSLEKFNKWVRKKSNAGPIILGSRIGHINNDNEALFAIIYNKTALVLNMLKDLIGEEKFFDILRKFIGEYKFQKVNTTNFKRFLEKESGLNLDQFFNNWFYSYELPEVHVFYNVSKSLNSYNLNIRLIQKKNNFLFPLWLQWKEGEKLVKKKIIVNSKEVNVGWHLDFLPKEIKVNPFYAVPGKFLLKKK